MNTDSYLRTTLRKLVMMTMVLCSGVSFAGITVSDVEVFSGYPWKEVVVGYTIAGADTNADVVRLTATDKTANKSYATVVTGWPTLTGAEFSAGRHVLRWNAFEDGVRFSSTNVVFTVSIVSYGVQLWENGPYWAECNVGARKPEDYGYYFWWGDTVGYQRNAGQTGWISVKDGTGFTFGKENCPTWQKYNSQLQSLGYIDATGNLTSAHDAATAHLGRPWRMPTDVEIDDLISNCDIVLTTRNGVKGWIVSGRGAYVTKSLFFPAAGYGTDSGINFYTGEYGSYWSSVPTSDNFNNAKDIIFSRSNFYRNRDGRYNGLPVRPVRGVPR